MAFKYIAVAACVASGLMSGTANASILDFNFYTGIIAKGTAITASGKIDAQHSIADIYKIVDVTGTIDGSDITGLKKNSASALFADASGRLTGTDNVSIWLETLGGVEYVFGFGIATSSAGDVSFGRLVVSSVPLPGSAPMFGTALLALAGIGYAAKRKKAAAAA